jgi:hypothetical protein
VNIIVDIEVVIMHQTSNGGRSSGFLENHSVHFDRFPLSRRPVSVPNIDWTLSHINLYTYISSNSSHFISLEITNLNLSHARTAGTRRTSTGTLARTTRLAPLDERKDHGRGVPSPGKPEKCHGSLRLAATLRAAFGAVGNFVVEGVFLQY